MNKIGKCGCSSLGNGKYKMFILYMTTLLSVLTFLLYIGGMAAWSSSITTLKSSAWATGTTTAKAYIGLQGYSQDVGNGQVITRYADCSGSVCDDCNNAGKAAMGLLIVSFFMTVGVAIGSIIRVYKDSDLLKTIIIILSFLVWIFSVAAFGVWNEECYKSFQDLSGVSNLSHSNGFGATVFGWIFINFILLFHVITPSTTSSEVSGNQAADWDSSASGLSPSKV